MEIRKVPAGELKRGDSFRIRPGGGWGVVVRTELVGDKVALTFTTGVKVGGNDTTRRLSPDHIFDVRN